MLEEHNCPIVARQARFLGQEFVITVERPRGSQRERSDRRPTSSQRPATEPPCSPVSQISSRLLPVAGATEIVTFRENYQTAGGSNESQQPWRILEWLIAYRLGHRQVVHITSHIASTRDSARLVNLGTRALKTLELPGSDPSQVSVVCETDASMTRSRISQSSPNMPEGILDKTVPLLGQPSFQPSVF